MDVHAFCLFETRTRSSKRCVSCGNRKGNEISRFVFEIRIRSEVDRNPCNPWILLMIILMIIEQHIYIWHVEGMGLRVVCGYIREGMVHEKREQKIRNVYKRERKTFFFLVGGGVSRMAILNVEREVNEWLNYEQSLEYSHYGGGDGGVTKR